MSNKTVTSVLLTIVSLLWLANASQEGTPLPANDNPTQQTTTISSGLPPRAQLQVQMNEAGRQHGAEATVTTQRFPRQAQQLISAKPTTTTESSRLAEHQQQPSDGLLALMDEKYLESNNYQVDGNQIDTSPVLFDLEDSSDRRGNPFSGSKSSLRKTQRQMEQRSKTADWWTKVVNENRAKKTQHAKESKQGAGKQNTREQAGVIYREQPLSQNALLTIRHQLMAIRDKHRLLVTKSAPQLMRLDQKLVDSYKWCLKRDQPLYAGMLYRTRDYVVRMANEIKHERQVLEAMAKQIQKVLRHKSTNSSLVKDYNRQLTTLTSAPTPSQQAAQSAGAETEQVVVAQHRLPSTTFHDASDTTDKKSNEGSNEVLERTSAGLGHDSSLSSWSSNELANGKDFTAASQKVAAFHRAAASTNDGSTNLNAGLSRDEKQVSSAKHPNIINSNIEQSTNFGDKQPQKVRKFLRKPPAQSVDSRSDSFGQQQSIGDGEAPTSGSLPTMRQRHKYYTVNVNEVNLKKELTKAQALIDRINSSSHELMSVVDDIVYLFRLSSNEVSNRKSLAALSRSSKVNGFVESGDYNLKRARKTMFRSPLKLLFERYGKMNMSVQPTSSVSPSTPSGPQTRYTTLSNMLSSSSYMNIDTSNAPEIKPLFNSSSFEVYKDPVDPDLGFDSPATLDI